ncbi:MAG: hypothetical protein KDI19_02975 [Pseudomonadales bacterium]|nr:hypothetical protein [Pseudomonadales bacterium]
MSRCLGILIVSLLTLPAAAEQSIHPKVQEALAWELPDNPCEPPDLKGAERDVLEADGAVRRFDVDTNKLTHYKLKTKRWRRCVMDYKQGLIDEFGKLKDSAQYGLTQEQANTILSKMATIQAVVESPTGQLEEAGEAP